MKTKKITKALFLLFLIVGITASCVKDDDFGTPDVQITEPELDADVVSISSVINELEQQSGEQYTFETENYMEGYVISSDEGGNFFREIILQDKAENPTAGIKVSLFVNPLYTHYQIGQKIYVKLKGFTIGTSNGLVTLGIPDGNFIGEAPESYQNNIVRSPEIAEIVPKPLTIEEFSDQYESMFIRLEGVKFTAEDALGDNPKTFASESDDEFDGERVLESCDSDATTIFSTSTFADFKSSKLPEGSGDIAGILARNFSDDYYVISVNTPEDILFEEERCGADNEPTPGEESGNYNPTDPLSLPFEEDFEGEESGQGVNLDMEGWANININGGTTLFEIRDFSSNNYAQAQAFSTDENPFEAWMITPGLIIDSSTENPVLSFDTKDGFFNGEALKVFVSTDFSGNVGEANWEELEDFDISTGNTDGYGNNFVPSGDIDLTEYIGETIYIGFQYLGGDGNITSTYQVDNVYVGPAENGGSGNTENLVNEDFEDETAGVDEFVNISGWDNINVNGGNKRFEVREFSDNKYAQTTAFNSEEDPYEVWLVSPEANVSSTSMLSFDSKDGYYNGDALSVYISTDYQGNPQTATWTALSASLSTGNTDGYGDNFVSSGDIDLSAYSGQDIRIGFKYEGGESGTTTTYQIDNVIITE